MGKLEFADYIKNHKWTFAIDSEHRDIRLSDKSMEVIESWKKFPSNKNFSEISRYIQFMYQKDSPLVSKFRDVKARRRAAITESGLTGDLAECILSMTDPTGLEDKDKDKLKFGQIVAMIVDFLMYQNDRLWARICIHESLFVEYSNVAMTGIKTVNNDKDLVAATNAKETTRKALNSVGEELDALYEKFLNHDTELEEVVKEQYRFTPEGISKKIQ